MKFSFILGTMLIFCFILSGCKSVSKMPKAQDSLSRPTLPATPSVDKNEKYLSGAISSPNWSPDGKSLIYSAKQRPGHVNSQIYTLDVDAGRERRITYSDGDAETPIFLDDGSRIIYASTTDELKERPALFSKKTAESTGQPQRPSSELYLSDLAGSDIQRLTNRPGFDGKPSPGTKGNSDFYFFSESDAFLQPFKFSLTLRRPVAVFQNVKVEISELAISNNQFAWLQGQELMLAIGSVKNGKKVELAASERKNLSWINGTKFLIFAERTLPSPNQKTTSWQIALYDTQTNCKKILRSQEGVDLEQASISPDQKRIAYLANKNLEIKWLAEGELSCSSAERPN